MRDTMNCPKCGIYREIYAQCQKCGIKMCHHCFTKEVGQCSSCGGINSVKPLKN